MTRNPPRARWRYLFAVLALAGLWLSMLLSGTRDADRTVYEALYSGHRPLLVVIARAFTLLGEPTILIAAAAVAAAVFWRLGRPRAGLALIAVTVAGRAVTEVQKYSIARVRPDIEPHLVIVKTSSFPSGHAASSMIFYLSFALLLASGARRNRSAAAAAISLSLLVGISRVMLGVHWPSDVIGGWSFGLLWVLLTLRPAERLVRSDSEMDKSRL
jgi:undecaprenyl-diphosphatase